MDQMREMVIKPTVMIPVSLRLLRDIATAAETLRVPISDAIQVMLARMVYDIKRDGCLELPPVTLRFDALPKEDADFWRDRAKAGPQRKAV